MKRTFPGKLSVLLLSLIVVSSFLTTSIQGRRVVRQDEGDICTLHSEQSFIQRIISCSIFSPSAWPTERTVTKVVQVNAAATYATRTPKTALQQRSLSHNPTFWYSEVYSKNRRTNNFQYIDINQFCK